MSPALWVLTLAAIVSFGTAAAMLLISLFSYMKIEWGAALVSSGLLLGGELFRRLSIRCVFYQWAHAGKR